MKIALSLLVAAFTFSVNAAPVKLSARHMKLIERAVAQKCYLHGELQLLENVETVDRIDQGVIDYYYASTFLTRQRVDQYIFDTYKVVVNSAIFSAYDHDAGDWGLIEVQSVSCKQVD